MILKVLLVIFGLIMLYFLKMRFSSLWESRVKVVEEIYKSQEENNLTNLEMGALSYLAMFISAFVPTVFYILANVYLESLIYLSISFLIVVYCWFNSKKKIDILIENSKLPKIHAMLNIATLVLELILIPYTLVKLFI